MFITFRRERGSRTKSLIPEQESVFSRRRRRVPSSSSNTSSPLTDDAIRYNLSISPPTTPTSKSNSNEVLLASLKLPVQMVSTPAHHADVMPTATPLSLTSDLSDIPYIEDAEVSNGYRSTTNVTPQIPTSKSMGSITKKSGFPLTKLKSQFKPTQLTLSAVPIEQGTKDAEKTASAGKQTRSNSSVEPIPHSVPVMTCKTNHTVFYLYAKCESIVLFLFISFAAITNIGGDMMRSKTAEFERMMTNQQQQTKPITKSHSQIMQSHGGSGARTIESKNIGTSLRTSDSSSNVRNGPIYKRRDVISSALNLKK